MHMDTCDPTSLGFDRERLQRIDRHLAERYLEPGRLPHAQFLLAREGQPIHFASLGVAREEGPALTDDAIFRIASMTKPITSIAYMMLLEEGLTALDDPVARVIPEFNELQVYAGGGAGVPFVTRPAPALRMIDLLRHMSGLTYGFQQRSNVDAAYRERRLDAFRGLFDSDGFIRSLAELPLEFDPGSAWNYSVSTDVLGVVVARLSGMSLGEFFRVRIFEPLGMVDTGFHCPEGKRARLTDAYVRHPQRRLALSDPGETSAWLKPPRFESGGGGLLSTTADYHRFCAMLLGGGALDGVRIVSPKTLQLMTANHLPGGADLTAMSTSLFSESANAGVGFGLGFAVNVDPARTMIPGTAGEYYWGGMYSTAFFVDPVERLTMVFMTQLMPSSAYPIRRELKTLIYSAMTSSNS
jgi:CubicO group peptidase (beta-lactamase class C family)